MSLTEKHCLPCEGGIAPLTTAQILALRTQVPQWAIAPDEKSISRKFSFENYYQTMAFVNAVAWMAHREDHHPDLQVSWGHVVVSYTTHAIGGLSENDIICAAKVDALGSPGT